MNINLDKNKVVEEVSVSLGADLWGYLMSDNWTDIMVNPDGRVWIDDGRQHEIPCRTTSQGLESAAMILASYSSQKFNSQEAQSLVTIIPIYNIRCSFIGPPAVRRVSVSFRKPSKKVIMPEELVKGGAITQTQMDFLAQAIKDYRNILISGGTGCHAKGEKIMMYDGTVKKVEDILLGEYLMGEDYTPRRVMTFHSGIDEMFTVYPSFGRPYKVNAGHILVLKDGAKYEYMTVSKFMMLSAENKKKYKMYYSYRNGEKKECTFEILPSGTGRYYGFSVDKDQLYLLDSCMVVHNSGKTTIMNSLMTLIDPKDRLYVVEDAPELVFTQPNVFSIEKNNKFDYAEAIAQALRQNPTRIIVGECRYPQQAIEMLQSWNTGHPGGMSTLHANSAKEVVQRLTELANRDAKSDQGSMVREAVDVVLQMRRLPGSSTRKLVELWDAKKDLMVE